METGFVFNPFSGEFDMIRREYEVRVEKVDARIGFSSEDKEISLDSMEKIEKQNFTITIPSDGNYLVVAIDKGYSLASLRSNGIEIPMCSLNDDNTHTMFRSPNRLTAGEIRNIEIILNLKLT